MLNVYETGETTIPDLTELVSISRATVYPVNRVHPAGVPSLKCDAARLGHDFAGWLPLDPVRSSLAKPPGRRRRGAQRGDVRHTADWDRFPALASVQPVNEDRRAGRFMPPWRSTFLCRSRRGDITMGRQTSAGAEERHGTNSARNRPDDKLRTARTFRKASSVGLVGGLPPYPGHLVLGRGLGARIEDDARSMCGERNSG